MLQELTQAQLEQALMWLTQPEAMELPQTLRHLEPIEWMMLERMLEDLQQEMDHSPIH